MPMAFQFILYALVGVSALAIDNGIFFALRIVDVLDISLCVIVARTIGAVYAFWCNRLLTFRRAGKARAQWNVEAVRYGGLFVLATSVNVAIVWLFTRALLQLDAPETETLVKVAADCMVFVFNFFASKFWVFRSRAAEAAE